MPDLTLGERRRIYEEEKARMESVAVPTQKIEDAGGFWRAMGIGLLLCVALLIVGLVMNGGDSTHKPLAPATAPQSALQGTGNLAHDKLSAVSETGQALILGQAVGKACDGDRAFYMGMDKERTAYWSVGCTDGRSYQVSIEADAGGSTKVLDCAVVRAINLNCFSRFSGQ